MSEPVEQYDIEAPDVGRPKPSPPFLRGRRDADGNWHFHIQGATTADPFGEQYKIERVATDEGKSS